jgi:hypothetical protein
MKVVIPGFEIVPTGGCDNRLYDSSCATSLNHSKRSFQDYCLVRHVDMISTRGC